MKQKWWRARWRGQPRGHAFRDIATCPICTQDKTLDQFTPREILHIKHHVKHPLTDLELSGVLNA